ncbi:MAG: hypothetical protein JW955_00130 [Sedimentisphaerales bacterium]|nr:hypothetical protein [Sedimentisphaerales bacterium]
MQRGPLTRRTFLQAAGSLAVVSRIGMAQTPAAVPDRLPPIRAITRGPGFHWFGYYDKLQFDPAGRHALGMEASFEHRSPRPDDTIKIGMVDLADNDRWIKLGTSTAWGWQQGCMLQWRPGSSEEVLWNDRGDDTFVAHLLNVRSGRKRMLPHPFYTISPDGRTAVTLDFRRINDTRPGYGYAGLPDPCAEQPAPKDSGIHRLDLDSGKAEMILSLADIAALGEIPGNPKRAKHWFNHLLFNTDGSRFVFLHRWRLLDDNSQSRTVGGFGTRMLTARPDGGDVRVVDPYGKTSHFIWRDPRHILAWAWHPSHRDAFYLYEDGSDKVEVVGEGVMTRNGHCSYLPGREWILNDTYPDKDRRQHVYLYQVATGRTIPLGRFYLAPKYTGEWRCDTHPRFSPDGRSVIIDSAHEGHGRQMYLIDISAIT